MTNEIMNEIEKEARKDAIAAFFTKHKKLFLRISIAIAIFLVLFLIFTILKNFAEEKYSRIFHQALIEEEIGNFSESQNKLKSIHDATFAPSGVKALASMRYAGLLLALNQKEQALEIYQEIAFTSRYDNFVQELSGLMAAKIINSDIKSNSDEDLKNKALKDIKKIVSNGKILKDFTNEQYAILLIKSNKKSEARKILEEISNNQKSSQSLKIRVLDLIKLTN